MLAEQLQAIEKTTDADRPKILVVEDDTEIARMLQEHLSYSLAAETRIAGSAEEALELDRDDPAEAIIIDYMLPDMEGLELIKPLNQTKQRPTVLITGHATLGRAIKAMRCGVVDMFVKPFDMDKLAVTVAQAVEKHRSQQCRARRHQKLRSLSKNVIKERRQLRRKLELVCRDLVNAYRDLAVKTAKLNRPADQN